MKGVKCLLIVVILSGFCGIAQAQESTYVTSTDNQIMLKIPEGFSVMDLNEAAALQYGNEDKGIYILVLNDTKEDIEGWNIKKHSIITLAKLLSAVNSPQIEGPVNLAVNGYQGVQFIVKGSVGGHMIVYYHTTFETASAFSQVLVWTIPSQFDKNKNLMNSIIGSFKSAK